MAIAITKMNIAENPREARRRPSSSAQSAKQKMLSMPSFAVSAASLSQPRKAAESALAAKPPWPAMQNFAASAARSNKVPDWAKRTRLAGGFST